MPRLQVLRLAAPGVLRRAGSLCLLCGLASLSPLAGCAEDAGLSPRYDVGVLPDGGVAQDMGQDIGGGVDQGTSPARYPLDRTLSPITPHVAAQLRDVAMRGNSTDDVFIKVGASASFSNSFMHCFSGTNVDLDGRTELQGTLDHFRAGDIGGVDPYDRDSLATEVGRGAAWAIAGNPSPLAQEVAAADPAYAVIMYGTNDIEQTNVFAYAESVLTLTDELLDDGIVPIWTTIMPRDDNPTSDLRVPEYNFALRAVAQARQVPLIDYHRELLPLPEHGLGADNLHPSTFSGGACVLTAAGLQHGYNVRNLLTLQTLDRVRAVMNGESAPDAPGLRQEGEGSLASPYVIDALPFVHHGNTLFAESDRIDFYTGCGAAQNESGPEVFYRLELSAETDVRVLVFDRGNVDIDAHWLSSPSGAACVARAHQDLVATLGAGTHYLSLDSFVDGADMVRAGEYLVVVLQAAD